eukprot:scaffold5231_cov120-Skeletonema_dohrnii-CCMP3373.AAC.1
MIDVMLHASTADGVGTCLNSGWELALLEAMGTEPSCETAGPVVHFHGLGASRGGTPYPEYHP